MRERPGRARASLSPTERPPVNSPPSDGRFQVLESGSRSGVRMLQKVFIPLGLLATRVASIIWLQPCPSSSFELGRVGECLRQVKKDAIIFSFHETVYRPSDLRAVTRKSKLKIFCSPSKDQVQTPPVKAWYQPAWVSIFLPQKQLRIMFLHFFS